MMLDKVFVWNETKTFDIVGYAVYVLAAVVGNLYFTIYTHIVVWKFYLKRQETKIVHTAIPLETQWTEAPEAPEMISKETKKKLFEVDDDNLHTIDTLVPSKKKG